MLDQKACLVCKSMFKPQRSTGKFCSLKCRKVHGPKTLAERFWKFVAKSPQCWLWVGSRDTRKGEEYGHIINAGKGKLNIAAHRASWILHFGEIPEGLKVCHKCDNPPCVRPDHLFLGTQKENLQDAARKQRMTSGEKNNQSRLKVPQVLKIRKLKQAGHSTISLAHKYSVSEVTIYAIANRRTWKHI